jgi:hypothetical protein
MIDESDWIAVLAKQGCIQLQVGHKTYIAQKRRLGGEPALLAQILDVPTGRFVRLLTSPDHFKKVWRLTRAAKKYMRIDFGVEVMSCWKNGAVNGE